MISKIRGFLTEREIAVTDRPAIVEVAIPDALARPKTSGIPME
jgi:hypothetical protein